MPQSKPSAHASRSRTRKVNNQTSGSKSNSLNKASRNRIAMLVRIQQELEAAPPSLIAEGRTSTENKVKRGSTTPQFSYQFTNPKGNSTPASVTKEDSKLDQAAIRVVEKTS